ncbi:MAG: hypothetical protein RR740_00755 [Pseudomonas sp.]
MSKKKPVVSHSVELLQRAASTCEHNAAINADEGEFAQENLNRELAAAYREGAQALIKAGK